MGLLDSLQSNIQSGLAGKKEGNATSQFDVQIQRVEQMMREKMFEIGRMYAGEHRNDATGEYAVLVDAIKQLEFDRDDLQKQKLAAQGLRECDHCHQIVALDSVFCNKCGGKLEPYQTGASEAATVCPQCGSPLTAGAVFCTQCGTKIG